MLVFVAPADNGDATEVCDRDFIRAILHWFHAKHADSNEGEYLAQTSIKENWARAWKNKNIKLEHERKLSSSKEAKEN